MKSGHWRALVLIAAAVAAAAVRFAWTQAGMLLLPDLVPWITGEYMYDATVVGTGADRKLIFSGTTANRGPGKLELRQGAVPGVAYQWIYDATGGHVEVAVGQFEEEDEPPHFRQFGSFDLRAVTSSGGVGPIVARSPKSYFSPHDSTPYDKSLPGASPGGQYFRTPPLDHPVGISVGWADIYVAGKEMQYIPLAVVPDGDYWLGMIVDPDDQLRESDKTNNTARILIRIQGGEVSFPPAPGIPPPYRVAAAPLVVSPNPWRGDRNAGGITFAGVASGSVIRIFNLSGRFIRSLTASAAGATWDLRSGSGQAVSSGLYLYRATGLDGKESSGQIAVIR